MVNLIPPSAKKSVILEYWIRVLTVWAWIATVIAVLLGVTLLPVYVLVDTKIAVFEESAIVASQKIASFETVSRELARATQQAQLIIGSSNEKSLSETIYLFEALQQTDIELEQVNVIRNEEGIAPVKLSGVARTRLSLADFRDRLLAEETIEAVDFPISNLAQDRDIRFSITVTMNNTVMP